MKRLTSLAIVFLFISLAYAQKPLATFYSSDGEEFTVIMDGKKINAQPQSRVEKVALDNDWAKVRIVFRNEEIPPIEKTIQGKDVDGNISSVTWEISQSNKGKWQIKPSSWSKIDADNTPSSNIVESPVYEERTYDEPSSVTQTTTTTVYSDDYNSGVNNMNLSINMTDQGERANMNISVSVPGSTVTQTQTQQTTTTIVTTTTTSENNVPVSEKKENNPLPGYNGKVGCSNPMTNDRFESVKKSISGKDFEDSKMTVAKQVLKSNCLFASQVKEIMQLFDFESTKLDFAKEAYKYTYDTDNYYILNDAFDFESSITDLNNYINK